MKSQRVTTLATYGVLALGGAGSIMLPGSLPEVPTCAPVYYDGSRETIVLKWSALGGRTCAGGVVGRGERTLADFDVGHYLVVSDHLVVRARAEVDNRAPLGSPDGNVADLCLDRSNRGLGVGSFVNVGQPGSMQISGGGENGSEVVSFICSGDRMLSEPRVLPASSIIVQVGDFDPDDSDLAVVLHGLDGRRYVFPPNVVEPVLTPISPRTYNLRFDALPGIAEVPAVERFDVRSGWYDPDRSRLTGGHFWLTAVSFDAEAVSPTHVVFQVYD